MRSLAGWGLLAAGLLGAGSLSSQTLSNQSLTGKYFFRHVSIGTDASGNITDARSLLGTITFDGAGSYTFTGQQIVGSAAAAPLTGSGRKYLVDPAGFVTLDSPQRTNETVNARLGPDALLGSNTESASNTFDLFVAIPAPTGAAAFSGPYWAVTLEFPGGNAANARSAIFSLNSAGTGQLAPVSVYGHGAAISSGNPAAQSVAGATFSVATDGTGTLSFGASSNTALLSGSRSVYLSAIGNMLLGGSTAPGSHDIIIGVKAIANPTAAAWNGNFWSAGLRFGAGESPAWVSYTGSAAARLAGSSTWYRRLKELGAGSSDFTFVNSDGVNMKTPLAGLITMGLDQIGLGTGGTFVGAAIDPGDPGAYEVFIGAPMANLSGGGVFLNPLGVTSAASFAPAGNPIAPGEFIALYGTGLAKSAQTAPPPFPPSLNGVTVLVNGKAAPIYYVSSGQINCLVPYSTTGPTATIQVQNSGTSSNTVTVPVAATAPGIYSLDSTGTGAGAILHSRDYSVVNAANPAAPGETVLVYLTGLGAVNPAVDDGKAGGSNPLNMAVMPTVYVADQQASVGFSGLAPGFPGLYQLNVTIPSSLPNAGNLPVAIQTGNAFHDQVFLPVQ
jgi:uncharacterized protein (TIGR03437 family)